MKKLTNKSMKIYNDNEGENVTTNPYTNLDLNVTNIRFFRPNIASSSISSWHLEEGFVGGEIMEKRANDKVIEEKITTITSNPLSCI